MAIDYHKKYAAEGRCDRCGEYLPEGFRYRECDYCREQRRESKKRKRAEEKARMEAEQRNKGKKQTLSLEAVSRMAAERGISYGQMVVLLEQGKA